jgi:hypothetical protein
MHHQRPQTQAAAGRGKFPDRRGRRLPLFPGPGVLDKDLQGLAAQDPSLIQGPQQGAGDRKMETQAHLVTLWAKGEKAKKDQRRRPRSKSTSCFFPQSTRAWQQLLKAFRLKLASF